MSELKQKGRTMNQEIIKHEISAYDPLRQQLAELKEVNEKTAFVVPLIAAIWAWPIARSLLYVENLAKQALQESE